MSWSLISSVREKSVGGANVTTGNIDTTGADLIVISCANYDNGGVPTISDNKSNTYTPLTTGPSAGAGMRNKIWYCVNPTVGSGHNFSTSAGAPQYPDVFVYAFSSGGGTPAFDSEGSGTNGNSVTSLAAGSITPSENGALLVTGFAFETSTMTSSIDSGYTADTEYDYSSGNNVGANAAWYVQAAAAAIAPTWSFTNTGNVSMTHAAFKGATPAGAQNQLAWIIA